MEKDMFKEETNCNDVPIVIPDECGDSMWDRVLKQSAFVQAVKLASDPASEDKK